VVFSLAGFINGVFAKNFDQVNWIPTFILTPLTYFGGVFYSINLLPDWARTLSFANPVLHMVNAFRYGFLGRSDVPRRPGLRHHDAGGARACSAVAMWLMERGIGLRD
jgi:ABC-2 type transport system permease protein